MLLKIIGYIFFLITGLILYIFSLIFYYVLWGTGGLIAAIILFPLVEIYPIVAWIVTGYFPGLLFTLWGIGILGLILIGIGSNRQREIE